MIVSYIFVIVSYIFVYLCPWTPLKASVLLNTFSWHSVCVFEVKTNPPTPPIKKNKLTKTSMNCEEMCQILASMYFRFDSGCCNYNSEYQDDTSSW